MRNAEAVSTVRDAMRDVHRQQPPKPFPAVHVENIKNINKGSLRAFCTVVIGGLKIHSCRVIQEESKAAWVSLPQQEWTGQDGKKRYSSIVEIPDPIKAAIQQAVLQAWEAQGQ
jgi:DNA-binding cell septation regulator SpoVG